MSLLIPSSEGLYPRLTVLNRRQPLPERTHKTFRMYIGRGSPLGNPFIEGIHGTRKEVIEKYRTYFYDCMRCCGANPKMDRAILELKQAYNAGMDIELVCHCVPKLCHGYVIKEFIESSRRRAK